jgi:hypothetical protein
MCMYIIVKKKLKDYIDHQNLHKYQKHNRLITKLVIYVYINLNMDQQHLTPATTTPTKLSFLC